MAVHEERYAFIAEWYDPTSSITRKFQIFYFNNDNSIEMYDIKARRPFLKRMPYEKISLKDFYIGNTMVILGRKMDIVDYGDEMTKTRLQNTSEKTIAVVTPTGLQYLGKIVDDIYNILKLQLVRARMSKLSLNDAKHFSCSLSGISQALLGAEKLTSGKIVVLELMGENSIRKWRDYLGLTLADDKAGCQALPSSVGADNLASVCYGSDCQATAYQDAQFFFESKLKNTASYEACTCCVIKPHILQSGLAGGILSAIIEAGFSISALELFHMEMMNAEEFYEVYKGVVAEYKDMVHQLVSGPCLAMEIVSNCDSTPKAFRELVGPIDPEIARQLRPTSIRARFGRDRVMNAVHCTDLPEDAVLEVEYFFKILSS